MLWLLRLLFSSSFRAIVKRNWSSDWIRIRPRWRNLTRTMHLLRIVTVCLFDNRHIIDYMWLCGGKVRFYGPINSFCHRPPFFARCDDMWCKKKYFFLWRKIAPQSDILSCGATKRHNSPSSKNYIWMFPVVHTYLNTVWIFNYNFYDNSK